MRKLIKSSLLLIILGLSVAQPVFARDSIIVDCGWNESAKYYNNVNCLLYQAIVIGEYLFQFIGAIAFIMFVYGGFKMILSFGNPDKVKQGQQILVSAVLGMIVAFGAYILVNFIMDALNVSSDFRKLN